MFKRPIIYRDRTVSDTTQENRREYNNRDMAVSIFEAELPDLDMEEVYGLLGMKPVLVKPVLMTPDAKPAKDGVETSYDAVLTVVKKCADVLLVAHVAEGGEYIGDPKHQADMCALVSRAEVSGVIRIMRRMPGEHAIWCFFGPGRSCALRAPKPRMLIDTPGSIFDATSRGKTHPIGALSINAFLSCSKPGNVRPNLVDYALRVQTIS